MTPIATASQKAAKRREVMLLWIKQLMGLQERMGNAKAAAAGWLAAIFALRAADRVDAGAQWGRIGDEIIDDLEWGYRQALGPEAEEGIAVAHRLLETHERPHIEVQMGGRKVDVNPQTLHAMEAKAQALGRRAQAPASRMQTVARGAGAGVGKKRPGARPALATARRPLTFPRSTAGAARPGTAGSARTGSTTPSRPTATKAPSMAPKAAPAKAKRGAGRKAGAKKR